MKVYVAPPEGMSRAMTRVETALTGHLPFGHHVVSTAEQADLEVLHVIGYKDTVRAVETAQKAGRRYAVIQYCLKSTSRPNVQDWRALWDGATAVWSYYALGHPHAFYAPLGIDTAFHRLPDPKGARPTLLLATGYVAASECLQECADAVSDRRGRMVHIGHLLKLGDHVTTYLDIPDTDLAIHYQQARFVAGLRRVEGFELPVYEGLACGARPIVFDAPHYRQWLGEHALYIPEDDSVADSVAACLQTYAPVTSDEMRWVKEKFSWKPIIEGFWERAL